MQEHRMIVYLVRTSQLFACAFLTISLFLVTTMGSAETQAHEAFNIRVQIKNPVLITTRNLSEYVRVISVKDDKGNALKMENPVKVKQGYHLNVEIGECVDFFRFANPVLDQLYAPLYLGKQVQVVGVSGADLAGKKATVKIRAVESDITVEAHGTINYLDQDHRTLDDVIFLTFKDDEILAYKKEANKRKKRPMAMRLYAC